MFHVVVWQKFLVSAMLGFSNAETFLPAHRAHGLGYGFGFAGAEARRAGSAIFGSATAASRAPLQHLM